MRKSGYKIIKGEPALIVEDTLVIADTHIGYEGEVRLKGIKLPSLTGNILERVLKLADETSAKRLLLLGDVKHTVYGPRGLEWRDLPNFLRKMVERFKWVGVVPGNHDGDLYTVIPDEVELIDPDGIVFNGILFTHGHKRVDLIIDRKMRSGENIRTVVVGHFHPAVELTDDLGYRYILPVWVIGMLGEEAEIVFMPAFNENTGRLVVNSPERLTEELRGFLRTGSVDLQEAEIYSLDLVFLGRVRELES
ncbi:MAG: metallophosphoesterase [Thermoproteota archaeon]